MLNLKSALFSNETLLLYNISGGVLNIYQLLCLVCAVVTIGKYDQRYLTNTGCPEIFTHSKLEEICTTML